MKIIFENSTGYPLNMESIDRSQYIYVGNMGEQAGKPSSIGVAAVILTSVGVCLFFALSACLCCGKRKTTEDDEDELGVPGTKKVPKDKPKSDGDMARVDEYGTLLVAHGQALKDSGREKVKEISKGRKPTSNAVEERAYDNKEPGAPEPPTDKKEKPAMDHVAVDAYGTLMHANQDALKASARTEDRGKAGANEYGTLIIADPKNLNASNRAKSNRATSKKKADVVACDQYATLGNVQNVMRASQQKEIPRPNTVAPEQYGTLMNTPKDALQASAQRKPAPQPNDNKVGAQMYATLAVANKDVLKASKRAKSKSPPQPAPKKGVVSAGRRPRNLAPVPRRANMQSLKRRRP